MTDDDELKAANRPDYERESHLPFGYFAAPHHRPSMSALLLVAFALGALAALIVDRLL